MLLPVLVPAAGICAAGVLQPELASSPGTRTLMRDSDGTAAMAWGSRRGCSTGNPRGAGAAALPAALAADLLALMLKLPVRPRMGSGAGAAQPTPGSGASSLRMSSILSVDLKLAAKEPRLGPPACSRSPARAADAMNGRGLPGCCWLPAGSDDQSHQPSVDGRDYEAWHASIRLCVCMLTEGTASCFQRCPVYVNMCDASSSAA